MILKCLNGMGISLDLKKIINRALKKYTQAAKISKNKSQQDFLLAIVETAEESDQIALMRKAYLIYLEMAPNSKIFDEIRYQLTYLLYREKKYSQAAIEFHKLVNNKRIRKSLQIQAADLSLDTLAIINDRNKIEQYTFYYANIF